MEIMERDTTRSTQFEAQPPLSARTGLEGDDLIDCLLNNFKT